MFFLVIIIFLLGLSLGSFINSLVWRLANDISLKGRSVCPDCKKTIAWYDNIPVFSFLRLKGKCRYCRKKIAKQYLLVEISTGILFVLAYFKFLDYQFLSLTDALSLLTLDNLAILFRDLLAIFILLLVFVFDWRYFLIPVNLLIIFFPLFWLLNFLAGVSWWWPIILALVVALFFFLQFAITKGKGLGEGDIWFGAFLAFLLPSWSELLVAILLAYFLGSLVGIVLMLLKKKQWQSKLPLGTFLVIGTIISIFLGDYIWSLYWNFLL
jgi:leader peptidase (prepilin peptidase) / N-methyltransferase